MSELQKSEEEARRVEYYRHEAQRYDQKRFSCECNKMYDRISKETIYSYLQNCKYVLDAGTGSGRFAIYLANKGINVVALDTSKEMLEISQRKAIQQGCESRIEFIVGDIENLPFRDAIFDGICSIIVLIHFSSKNLAMSEFSRVLKPDGNLVIDVPNKALSKVYGMFLSLIGRTTFKDYHYGMKDARKLLQVNSIEIVDRRRFGKIPRLIIHLFLCILNLKFLRGVVERFEKFNFGGTSIIKGLKVE